MPSTSLTLSLQSVTVLSATDGKAGFVFTALTSDLYRITATKQSTANPTRAYLMLRTGVATGTELAKAEFVDNVATFNYHLTSGESYFIVADSEGASYNRRIRVTASFPFTNAHINVTSGVDFFAGTETVTNHNFNSVTTTAITHDGHVTVGTGTAGTKYLNTNYPIEEGLTLGTNKLPLYPNL